MTRHRILLSTLASLPLSALALCFNPPFVEAQSSDYLPPQQPEPPRSTGLRRPDGSRGSDYSRSGGDSPGYGQPYSAPPPVSANAAPDYSAPPPDATWGGPPPQGSYSSSEILDAGRGFFGGASEGLAKVVEYSFERNGRPNGYIL